jgi:hypothetical protein
MPRKNWRFDNPHPEVQKKGAAISTFSGLRNMKNHEQETIFPNSSRFLLEKLLCSTVS